MTDETRTCRKCNTVKPIDHFRFSKPGYRRRTCKECMDAAAVAWRDENKERAKAWWNDYYARNRDHQIAKAKKWNAENTDRHRNNVKSWYRKLRRQIIEAYGGKCACCGETEYSFLTIDHVNDDGYKNRWKKGATTYGPHSGYSLLKVIRDRNFPPDFQVLCANCNTSKALNNGVCAHAIKKVQRSSETE